MRAGRSTLLIVLALLLAGCAGLGSRSTGIVPADIKDLHRWQARGRMGVSGPEGGGSGSFDWQQRGDRAEVQLRGPVGIGSVRLQVHGSAEDPRLRLETGNGQVLESEAAWRELETRLGVSIPAGSLRYWMLGVPAPGEHRWIESSEPGTSTLEQDGWRIDYQRYSEEPGLRMPVRIRAVSGDARVRIVVDRWQLAQ
jgi:outer membrane lipoprotein LolB